MNDIKAFLKDQAIIIGKDDQERKLQLTDVLKIEGEASVAVIRGQPRMGYELNLKIELTGMQDTYL